MKTTFPYRGTLELATFEYGCLARAKYEGCDEAEARGRDEQPLSVKLPLIRCGETYSAWQYQFEDTVQSFG